MFIHLDGKTINVDYITHVHATIGPDGVANGTLIILGTDTDVHVDVPHEHVLDAIKAATEVKAGPAVWGSALIEGVTSVLVALGWTPPAR